MGFGGGAPKSLLEYARSMQAKGHSVTAIGQYTFMPSYYHKYNIETRDIDYFVLKKPIKNIVIIFKNIKIFKKINPDIIHVTTLGQSLYQKISSKLLNSPTVYMIPGGSASGKSNKVLHKILDSTDKIIVYTSENIKQLKDSGFRDQQLILIPNRFSFNDISNHSQGYAHRSKQVLKMLLISRISNGKENSIHTVINFVHSIKNLGYDVRLDIIGNGTEEIVADIENKIKQVNNQYSNDVVYYHGYQDNVDKWIEAADICFGKGRSVIDPVSVGKISYVVNENDNIIPINKTTIQKHLDYNFAGRNFEHGSDVSNIRQVVESIIQNQVNTQELDELRDFVIKNYDINEVADYIEDIYNEVIHQHMDKNIIIRIIGSFYLYFKIYFLLVFFKLRG